MEHEIDTKAVHPYLRAMAVAGKKYTEREKARQDLARHIEAVKRISRDKRRLTDEHFSTLWQRIDSYVQKESRLAHIADSNDLVRDKMEHLLRDLNEAREENAAMKEEYEQKIKDLKKEFAFLQSKLKEFIQERKERESRLEALHKRVVRKPH